MTAIDVATGNGNDHVTYELESSLTTPNQELVFVGSGARNGRGTVQFTFNIVGAIEDGSNLVALAVPGAKNPTMLTVNDSGEIDGDFSAGTSLFGETKIKPGPEKFSERQGHPHRQRLREHQGERSPSWNETSGTNNHRFAYGSFPSPRAFALPYPSALSYTRT